MAYEVPNFLFSSRSAPSSAFELVSMPLGYGSSFISFDSSTYGLRVAISFSGSYGKTLFGVFVAYATYLGSFDSSVFCFKFWVLVFWDSVGSSSTVYGLLDIFSTSGFTTFAFTFGCFVTSGSTVYGLSACFSTFGSSLNSIFVSTFAAGFTSDTSFLTASYLSAIILLSIAATLGEIFSGLPTEIGFFLFFLFRALATVKHFLYALPIYLLHFAYF